MSSGTTVTEMPAASVLTRQLINSQILTQHVAAADDVAGFEGRVDVGPPLVSMGTGLRDKQHQGLKCDRSHFEFTWTATNAETNVFVMNESDPKQFKRH